jgi:hypothetical protein
MVINLRIATLWHMNSYYVKYQYAYSLDCILFSPYGNCLTNPWILSFISANKRRSVCSFLCPIHYDILRPSGYFTYHQF